MTIEHTLEYDPRTDQFYVYAWDEYPEHSVLAGQTRKSFKGAYFLEADALADYPKAVTARRQAHNTFNHLPGEDDPVPGGMFPDDWGD